MPKQQTAFYLLFFLLPANTIFGQPTRIDGLRNQVYAAKEPAARLDAVLHFCAEWDSYSPDTLQKYMLLASELAAQTKNVKAATIAEYYQAVYLYQRNRLDTALSKINNVMLRYKQSFPYDGHYENMYGLRSNIHLRTSAMDELMATNFELMKLAESNKDTSGISRATLNVGNAHLKMARYGEALHWYHQALGWMKNPAYKKKHSFIYNNIAITFYHLKNEDSAKYYIGLGVQYAKEANNFTNLANALFIQGGLFTEFSRLKEAEESFQQAVEARKRIGDIYYLINDMSSLAIFYAQNNETGKGIALSKEGIALAQKNGMAAANLFDLYEALSRNYWAAADYKSYGETVYEQLALKDSIYKKNSAEAMAEMQAKYDVQKKETTIARQKLALVSKNYQLYGLLLLSLLVILFSYILLRQYRKKQKLRLQLLHEEERRRAEKEVAEAEEAERKRIAADLHDSLGAYAASIVSNIDHLQIARHEQGNLIAMNELRKNSLDMVSQLSDTIWAMKKDALSLTAISDRIKVFIQRMQTSYPGVTIDVVEDILNDQLLPPSQAFHLFQIVKEAISNALRHSRCHHLTISIRADKSWKIHISDDGTGLQQKLTISEGGNGLINMRSRAQESGWNIEWLSNEPRGTQVVIENV